MYGPERWCKQIWLVLEPKFQPKLLVGHSQDYVDRLNLPEKVFKDIEVPKSRSVPQVCCFYLFSHFFE